MNDFVSRIAPGLVREEPIARRAGETASVAVVFRGGARESFLLIRRAERKGDPWSGDVAFPGGRVEAEDRSFLETAAREAREEVGLDLNQRGRFLGYLGEFVARMTPISVVPSVFLLVEDLRVTENREVVSHRWVSSAELVSKSNRTRYFLERSGQRLSVPAFSFGDYLVWGLTERILAKLVELAGTS